MNLEKEIIEEFFKKLDEDNEIPNNFKQNLRALWTKTRFNSKKTIQNLIYKNVGENFED